MNKKRVAFWLFFLSGLAGISYELVWLRMFAPVLGVDLFTLGSVMAVYMAGMGWGALFWGKFIDNSVWHPLLVYGFLEVGLAGSAALVPLLLAPFDQLYFWFFHAFDPGFWGAVCLRFCGAFLLLIVPSFFMGGTLPVLSTWLTKDSAYAAKEVGWLYATNLGGAVLGIAICGFYALEVWGVSTTYYLIVGISVLVACSAVLFALLFPQKKTVFQHSIQQKTASQQLPLNRFFLFAAGMVGFTGMQYEVLWSRILSLVLRNTVYAYSVMLITVLTGFFLGDLLATALLKRVKHAFYWLGLTQAGAAVYLLWLIPYYVRLDEFALQLRTGSSLWSSSWGAYLASRFLVCSIALLLPALLLGTAFPLLVKLFFDDSASKGVPERWGQGRLLGRLYFWDTMGMVLAALVMPTFFVSWLGTHYSMLFALGGTFLFAFVCFLQGGNRKQKVVSSVCLLAVIFTLFNREKLHVLFPDQEAAAHEQLLFCEEDYQGIVEVYQDKQTGALQVVSNRQQQEGDSSPSSLYNQREQFYLPLLLHPHPDDVLVIGLGTGISFEACAYLPHTQATCIELSSAMVSAAAVVRKHLPVSPKQVPIIVADGRNYLKRTKQHYDLIIADLFTPYRAGVGNLYAQEHYQEVKKHLKPGGMVAQLLPAHQLPFAGQQIIMNTFMSVFPQAVLFMTRWNFLLVAVKDQAFQLDWAALLDRFDNDDLAVDLQRYGLDDPYQLVSGFVSDLASFDFLGDPRQVTSDDHPVIEFLVPQYMFNQPDGPLYYENITRLLPYRTSLTPYLVHITADQKRTVLTVAASRKKSLFAKQAAYKNNYMTALKLYQEVIQSSPADPDAAQFLSAYQISTARQLERGGLQREANRHYRKGKALLPWKKSLQ